MVNLMKLMMTPRYVPSTAPKKKVESKSKSVVVDDEDISLDDIGSDDLEK